MPEVKDSQLAKLSSYLEQSGPSGQEWGMRCPLHDDHKRSASLNVNTGLWYCQTCEEGGKVTTLLRKMKEQGISFNGSKVPEFKRTSEEDKQEFPYNDNHVRSWQSRLVAEGLEEYLLDRGLSADTIRDFEIGHNGKAYTIPIRDVNGDLVQVRFYDSNPDDDRRKIWGVKGFGEPRLYPIDSLIEADEIIICEGEWDTMLAIQHGFNAITRTGAARVWDGDWNKHFAGMTVYLCHDMDTAGQAGNAKVRKALQDLAASVFDIQLPYEVDDKHGHDLTDFFMDGYSDEDLRALMDTVQEATPESGSDRGVVDVRLVDSLGSDRHGERMRMRVTVTGKRNPPYMLPKDIQYDCTMDAGKKCETCPMMSAGGHMERTIPANDEILLSLINIPDAQLNTKLRDLAQIPKCTKLDLTANTFQPLEELYVRPSIDTQITSKDPGDYTSRRVFGSSRHDTKTNSTVEMVGSVFPNPKNQLNEFMAWETGEVDTDVDKFVIDKELGNKLKIFRHRTPLIGLEDIVDDLAANVTGITGRSTMHVFMDLVFHSALSFNFLDEEIRKGWLDAIIIGDTRTGKSEAADKLRQHYGLGEMITCESSSYAGVVGGLHQFSANVWEVSWGSIPLNDRRMVIMDEISGLHPEEIAQMSSIRSSGEAQITKIKSERTLARTRLLWIGNPRNAKMRDFTYGVYAIKPLVGNAEDVARFDMAMGALSEDVEAENINTAKHRNVPHVYTADLCRSLVLWCWSRTPEQIIWARGSEQLVLDYALELADEFSDEPPLIQGANVRVKLARIAVAIAGRLFSSDRTFENLIVRKVHVKAAFDFIKVLYENDRFGYEQVSAEDQRDKFISENHEEAATDWAYEHLTAAKLIKTRAFFRRSDLEDVLNITREEANEIVNLLWEWRMIRREGPDNYPTEPFQRILRDTTT